MATLRPYLRSARWALGLVIALAGCAAALPERATPRQAQLGRYVVVVVMDGLRPDTVTAEQMPALFGLARHGVIFARHRAVFVSSTEVNGAALATGCHPQTCGVIANREFRPAVDPRRAFLTNDEAAVRKADALSHGHYLATDTIAETLRQARRPTTVSGTKGVALLMDRDAARPTGDDSVVYFAGKSIGIAESGAPPFPPLVDSKIAANAAQDAWTTDRLVHRIQSGPMPTFSVLWLSEPDFAQHGAGLGSPVAKAALLSSDRCLARVLAALDQCGVRERTNIFIVSDHGFSTITRAIDMMDTLNKAGFRAFRELNEKPKPGDVLVVGNGGATSLYVAGHDADTIARLVEFLQGSDFAGVIFTRRPQPGTFDLGLAKIASADAPDILFSMAWSEDRNPAGIAGGLVSEGLARGPGQGMHASLSPYDMHNTLIVAGPDFQRGVTSELPSGNTDVAPTVMAILGFHDVADRMDGRVLTEAFLGASTLPSTASTRVESVERRFDHRVWRQSIQITQMGKATYIDRGDAQHLPAGR